MEDMLCVDGRRLTLSREKDIHDQDKDESTLVHVYTWAD